jgi:hypothetical protein
MSADRPQQIQATEAQHARDLLVRLYREIGISAVAAALQIPPQKPSVDADARREIPPMLRKDIAA